MKLKLLFLILLFTTISKGQEVFTDAFLGNIPFSLVTIEDELFVSVFSDSDERLAGVHKLPFDNPNSIETITETSIQTGIGPLYITHDSVTNTLFGLLPIGLITVDLNQTLPAPFEILVDNSTLNIGDNNGLIYHEGFIYFTVFDSGSRMIYRVVASGESDPELFFTIPEADSLVITQIVNNELYYFKYNNSIGTDLLKINIADPSSETLISTVDGFAQFVQSSHFVNNTLFVGLENNGSSPSILKFDLTQNLPITVETISASISVGSVLGITSYEDDLYFTDGNSRNIFRLEDGVLNVSEFENLELSVFPNPTSDRLFIEGQNSNRIEYQLIDMLGKLIHQGLYTASGIDFSNLDTGIYFVKTSDTNGNTLTRKVVKN